MNALDAAQYSVELAAMDVDDSITAAGRAVALEAFFRRCSERDAIHANQVRYWRRAIPTIVGVVLLGVTLGLMYNNYGGVTP